MSDATPSRQDQFSGTKDVAEQYRLDEARLTAWLDAHASGRVLYLELGVGANTPGIIKYPFWRRVAQNPQAVYAVVNKGEAYVPPELREHSIALDGDIAEALVTVEKELA